MENNNTSTFDALRVTRDSRQLKTSRIRFGITTPNEIISMNFQQNKKRFRINVYSMTFFNQIIF